MGPKDKKRKSMKKPRFLEDEYYSAEELFGNADEEPYGEYYEDEWS